MARIEGAGATWQDLPQSNSDRMRHWFEWVWNQGVADLIDVMFPEDGLAHGLGDEPVRGPAQFRPFHTAFLARFSPVVCELPQVVESGEMVTAHIRFALGAGEQRVFIQGLALCRMQDGCIAEASRWIEKAASRNTGSAGP